MREGESGSLLSGTLLLTLDLKTVITSQFYRATRLGSGAMMCRVSSLYVKRQCDLALLMPVLGGMSTLVSCNFPFSSEAGHKG